mgnify:CR=1 FL=1
MGDHDMINKMSLAVPHAQWSSMIVVSLQWFNEARARDKKFTHAYDNLPQILLGNRE